MSYGAYLYHLPLIGLCVPIRTMLIAAAPRIGVPAARLLWAAIIVALTLAVSSVSYRFIEQPFLALKDRVAPQAA